MTACVGADFRSYMFLASGNATQPRTFPDRLADTINVKEFNAKGDGSTNDETAVQAAVQEALNRGGGTVYFPGPARYKLLTTGFLTVGSNSTTARVNLVGNDLGSTIIEGISSSTPIISKGIGVNDNIGRIENLSIIGGNGPQALIKLEGQNQSVIHVTVSGIIGGTCGIDASNATNAYIGGIIGSGGSQNGDANSAAPGPIVNTVGIYIGKGCVGYDCRMQGNLEIAYALSGNCPSLISCSAETLTTGVRVGWALVAGVPTEVTAFGFSIIGFQAEKNGWANKGCCVDLYNCNGGVVCGVSTSGSDTTSLIRTPGPIQSASWASPGGVGTATVTTVGNHNIPVGNWVLTLDTGNNTWFPAYGTSGSILATRTSANTFTYDLPVAPTGSIGVSTWTWPTYYAIRFRKVQGVSIQGGYFTKINVVLATFDFDYDGAAVNHANNVLYSGGTLGNGTRLPQSTNPNQHTILGGWTFYGTGSLANPLDGHGWRSANYTVASPGGNMMFADLPGQSGFQPGPLVGQEFDIIDGTLPSSGNFAATQTGGGANKTRVRWDSAHWIITG